MCIAAWVWLAHPAYPLILLLNRDELHDRPTKPEGWWGIKKLKKGNEEEANQKKVILGGRDIQGGGTWMGCSEDGSVAFLTNVLERDVIPGAKTRGDLPVRFLKSSKTPMEFAEVGEEAELYNGFNLVVADLVANQMMCVSNRNPTNKVCGTAVQVHVVTRGLHVLTNTNLDTPWHKARRLGQGLERSLLRRYGEREERIRTGELVKGLLMDTAKAAVDELPSTGCDAGWEIGLSSVFVDLDTHMGRYGTRSQVELSVEWGGAASFYGRYLEVGAWKEHTLRYHVRHLSQPPLQMLIMPSRQSLDNNVSSANGSSTVAWEWGAVEAVRV